MNLIAIILLIACPNIINAQSKSNAAIKKPAIAIEKTIIPDGIGMKKDILEDRVKSKVLLDIDEKSAMLISDGIESIDATKQAIVALEQNKINMAIDYIGIALGKLETVAIRSPKMKDIPISRIVRTDDLDTDLGAIKTIKQNISKALDNNKFHKARLALESLMSEVRIETTHIPIGKYPEHLKKALIYIENNQLDVAKSNLGTLLNTLTVSKENISLPCMRAEVLIEEALNLPKNHSDLIANIKLLLLSAQNQINIAYELGQIEKIDYENISKKINSTSKSMGTNKFTFEANNIINTIQQAKNKYNEISF